MDYLKNHQILSSRDLHETRELLATLANSGGIDVIGRGAEIDAAVRAVSFGGLNLVHTSFGDVQVQIGLPESDMDSLFLVVLTHGAGTVSHQGQDHDLSIDKGLMRDMRQPLSAREDRFACFGLPLPIGTLKRYAHSLIGPAASMVDLEFDPGLDLSTPGGRHMRDTLHYVANALDGPLRDLDNPIVLDGLRDMLLTNILMLLPNSYTDMLRGKPASSAVPHYVKRARDHIHAHARTSITLEDLARHAGCGYRTLQTAFNAAHGMSPMAYVRAVRLTHVHEELLKAEDGVTVSDVAAKWGFLHVGRFAQSYARQFGELPSQTLRRRK